MSGGIEKYILVGLLYSLVLAILVLYTSVESYMEYLAEKPTYYLIINSVNTTIGEDGWHHIILNISASRGVIPVTEIFIGTKYKLVIASLVHPDTPFNVSSENYTLVNITIYNGKISSMIPKDYESPSLNAIRLKQLAKEQKIPHIVVIYYENPLDGSTHEISIDFTESMATYIRKHYGRPYDFAIIDTNIDAEGNAISGMLIGNLKIHVKNYVNKTIHIREVRAYIYDKKHNRLYWQLPEQIIRVNITLNPYEERVFSVTVKVPFFTYKYYLKVYVYSLEGEYRKVRISI